MGSFRLTLCTGLLACAAGLSPTAARAADGQGVTVTPASPAPGSVVALRVSGCSGTTGAAASTAFVSDAPVSGYDGTLTGQSQVRSTIGAGAYDVKVTCGGQVVTGTVTVVGQASLAQPDGSGALQATPVAPVHAGGGGTAPFASVEPRSTGPDTAQAVTGLVLVGFAAAAVGLLGARRRHGSR